MSNAEGPFPIVDILNKCYDETEQKIKTKTELEIEDIEIGAVELKNADDDTRAKVKTDGVDNALVVTQNNQPLPTGAATDASLTDGTQKTQIVDSLGNIIGSTSNALDVNIKSGVTLEVNLDHANDDVLIYGNDGATDQKIKTDSDGHTQVDILTICAVTVTDVALSDGTQKSQIVDSLGNIIGSTGNALDVNIKSGITLEVNLDHANDDVLIYGYDGASDQKIKTDAEGHLQIDVISGVTVTDVALSDGTQKSQIVDSLGNIIGSTNNALDVNIKSGVTLEVNLDHANDDVLIYGYDGASDQKIKTDAEGHLLIDVVSGVTVTDVALSDGTQKSQIVDSLGNIIGSTNNALDVNIKSGITLEVNLDHADDDVLVYGNDGATDQKLKTDSDGHLQIDLLTLPSVTVSDVALTDGTQKSQVVDSLGNIIGSTGNALDVNIKSGCHLDIHLDHSEDDVLIYGYDGAADQKIKTDSSGHLQIDLIELPSVTVTAVTLSDGTQKTQIVDSIGNVIGSTNNALQVDVINLPDDPAKESGKLSDIASYLLGFVDGEKIYISGVFRTVNVTKFSCTAGAGATNIVAGTTSQLIYVLGWKYGVDTDATTFKFSEETTGDLTNAQTYQKGGGEVNPHNKTVKLKTAVTNKAFQGTAVTGNVVGLVWYCQF